MKTISLNTKEKYNNAVLKIFNTNKHTVALGPIIVAFLIWLGLINLLPLIIEEMTSSIGIILLFSLPIIIIICILIYNKKAKKSDIIDTNELYLNEILKPIITEFDKNTIVDNFPNQAPLYGKLNLTNKDEDVIGKIADNPHLLYKNMEYQNLYNTLSPYIYDNTFGKWLVNNRIIPKFNFKFYMSLHINTLLSDNGFWFTNATANSYHGDNHIITEFKGIIFAIQIPIQFDNAVNIYTTKNILNQEINNGYKKDKDIINTENEIFNQNFDVISEDKINTFYILTPLCIEYLLKLKEKYKIFGIYIYKNCMYVGINNGKYLLDKEIIVDKTLEPLSFDEYMNNIYQLYEITDDFRTILKKGQNIYGK